MFAEKAPYYRSKPDRRILPIYYTYITRGVDRGCRTVGCRGSGVPSFGGRGRSTVNQTSVPCSVGVTATLRACAGGETRDIGVVALCAVRRGDELLVYSDESPVTGALFYRRLSGGVEFGEHSRAATLREFDEELSVVLVDPTPVGPFERVFTVAGETKHELWRVYDGRIVEDWPYERDSFRFVEPKDGTEHTAEWVAGDRLRADETTFYTPAVLDARGVWTTGRPDGDDVRECPARRRSLQEVGSRAIPASSR